MNVPTGKPSLESLHTALAVARDLQHLAVRVLSLLSDDSPFPAAIHAVVSAIQDGTGTEAVGIRLRNGDDFNFVAAQGFSDALLASENALASRNEQGSLCKGEGGHPIFEGACGLVLSGRSRNLGPAFTESGSCFLNHGEASLVFDAACRSAQIPFRGHCFREGYESIAWVPIRAKQDIVGLLLLCDKRPDRFSSEMMAFLEGLSASIGLALARKQAEEELSLKTARLKLALTSVGMGVWSWQVRENRRTFDEQTCRLLGISPATFGGAEEEFFNAVHPDDREAVRSALRHTLASSGMYETEYRVIWSDGSIHHLATRGTCVRDASGEPIRIEGVLWDVTEHRLAEAALRRNEALQHAIISNISDVIAILDSNGINRFKSSNLGTWFGWQPDEVVGKSAAEHVHPDDIARLQQEFSAVSAEPGATLNTECRYLCKDGTYTWIEVHAVNLLEDANIAGILLNYHDVSQRKRAEAALRESEERYRVLFHSSREALITAAPPNWRFTDCNQAAVSLFGARDATDFKSRTPWDLSPERQPDGDPSEEKLKAILEATMHSRAYSFEWVHRTVAGDDFPATVSLAMAELNGVPLLQATVRDESERQQLLARMAQSDRLASMGMLAAGVAHEINNPLAFVRYNIESLTEDLPKLTDAVRRMREGAGERQSNVRRTSPADTAPFDDTSLEDLVVRTKETLEGIERIVSITRALSTFSRVEQANCAEVNVAAAIDAAINMAHNEVTHRARLVRSIEPVPPVWASEGKLSHAFLNLLVNAAQAIDEGDVANNLISVRAWPEGSEVIVEISDSGKGIDPANLERIFEPFYTTKRLGSGPGLGLSISKSILSELGGTLKVASKVGVGSRFTVRLPATTRCTENAPHPGPSEVNEAPVERARILLIEDEPGVVRLLTRMLGKGYSLVSTASGKDAQEVVSANPDFDLILCDLMMSPMSGTEFHAWLTQQEPGLANRLIFITGGAFTPKAREYLGRVGVTTLEKPFDAAEVRRRVAEAIQAHRRCQ